VRISLWLKLMGILAVIVAAGTIVTFVMINRATTTQFRRFVLTGDIIQAENLSLLLADYYARQGSWQGVETFLSGSPLQTQMMRSMMSGDTGYGMMGDGMMGNQMGRGMMGDNPMQQDEMVHDMVNMVADRAILVDARGVIVADSHNSQVGQPYPDAQLAAGVPVTSDGQQIGTVLVGSMIEPILNPLSQDFLRSVNLAVLASAITVGILALALGSFFFFHITTPVRDLTRAAEAVAGGDLTRRVTVRSQDELSRLAQAFNSMTGAMKHNETLRRQMVADIAHELRNPLGLIQGSLEAMLDGIYELNEENVASVHEETLVLTRLVKDLRDLAQAEAGQLHLEREELDINDLISRAAELFRAEAAERQVALITDLSPDLPPLHGDGQRLNQVLVNLLSNALRYTPPEGQVTVSARLTSDETEIGVQAQRQAAPSPPVCLISVADTGQGIPPEDLPYVFERFYRADKSRARGSGGSGLGLAIARQIVAAHGGRIWVESQAGAGSTFSFALPTGLN
jgi:signal transduction histidine kinase